MAKCQIETELNGEWEKELNSLSDDMEKKK